MDYEYEDIEGEEDLEHLLEAQAKQQSYQEASSFAAYFRFYTWLTSLNRNSSLQPSMSGAITMTKDAMRSIDIGFSDFSDESLPNAVFFQFQNYHYDFLSKVGLEGAWIEGKGVCLVFKAVKYADYLHPMIRLYFPIVNEKVFEEITKCEYATITLIEPSILNDGKIDVLSVYKPAVPLLRSPPQASSRKNAKNWVRAF